MEILSGGGGSARRDAERSRRLQEVANQRQLSEQRSAQASEGLVRRRPRGRRLFADASAADLQDNLS